MFLCYDRTPGLLLTGVPVRDGLEGAGDPAYFWDPGEELRVRFLDGTPELRRQVMAAAQDWTRYAHLRLRVVGDGDAEIRITFDGPGNWSALGTTCRWTKMFAPSEPTMCLGEVPGASPSRLAQVVRHEFGHAIGLIHEHSSPSSGIRWNKPEVFAALAGPPNYWSKARVAENVFDRYSAVQTQYTQFDPHSVMLYAIPANWTIDGLSFPENVELSAQDKAFVGRMYPMPAT